MDEQILSELVLIRQYVGNQYLSRKAVLCLEEAAKYLNISKSFLYKLTSTNALPFYCPNGKKIFFRRNDLDHWMLTNRQASTEEINESAINFKLNSKKRSTL